jgi:hypothetical protein
MCTAVIRMYHNTVAGTHGLIKQTEECIHQNYMIESLSIKVREYVNSCHKCHSNKHGPAKPTEMTRYRIPGEPFEKIHTDIKVLLKPSNNRNKYILTFRDLLTRCNILIAMPDKSSIMLINALVERVITQHTCQNVICSDGAKEMVAGCSRKHAIYTTSRK